jgi:hypothetical protein
VHTFGKLSQQLHIFEKPCCCIYTILISFSIPKVIDCLSEKRILKENRKKKFTARRNQRDLTPLTYVRQRHKSMVPVPFRQYHIYILVANTNTDIPSAGFMLAIKGDDTQKIILSHVMFRPFCHFANFHFYGHQFTYYLY